MGKRRVLRFDFRRKQFNRGANARNNRPGNSKRSAAVEESGSLRGWASIQIFIRNEVKVEVGYVLTRWPIR